VERRKAGTQSGHKGIDSPVVLIKINKT